MSDQIRQLDFATEVDLNHPLTQRRIPVVSGPRSRFAYHVALAVGPEYGIPGATVGLEPTPEEADQLCAYLQYRMDWYNQTYRARLAQRPFDVDGGAVTYTFRKTDTGWQYSVSTWTYSTFVPNPLVDERRFETLPELLNHIYTWGDEVSPRWAEFTAGSPAFAAG